MRTPISLHAARAALLPLLALLAPFAPPASAGVPMTAAGIHRSGERLPADLAYGVERAFSVGQDGWLAVHHMAVVSPESFPYRSDLGLHHGWPFRQSVSFGAMRAFGDFAVDETLGKTPHRRTSPQGWRGGLFFSMERRGWDNEDFLLVRPGGDQALGYAGYLFGALVDRPKTGLQFGAGALARSRLDWVPRDGSEDLSEWTGWGRVGFGAFQSWILAGDGVRGWSVGLDLEQRSLEGAMVPGFARYLPRVRLEAEELADSLRLEWEQPLWDSRLYARTLWSLDEGFRWGELAFWLDPSRFFGLAATWLRRDGDDLFGGRLRLGLLEVGYSYAPDVESLGGMEKSVYVTLGFAITRLSEIWYGAPGAGGFASGIIDDGGRRAERKVR